MASKAVGRAAGQTTRWPACLRSSARCGEGCLAAKRGRGGLRLSCGKAARGLTAAGGSGRLIANGTACFSKVCKSSQARGRSRRRRPCAGGIAGLGGAMPRRKVCSGGLSGEGWWRACRTRQAG